MPQRTRPQLCATKPFKLSLFSLLLPLPFRVGSSKKYTLFGVLAGLIVFAAMVVVVASMKLKPEPEPALEEVSKVAEENSEPQEGSFWPLHFWPIMIGVGAILLALFVAVMAYKFSSFGTANG